MDFLTILQQYMDVYAVVIAIGLTQVIKYFLPSIPGEPAGSIKWPWARRGMPILPVIIAIMAVIFKETLIFPSGSVRMAWDDALIKGMISGFAAAYFYRTTKVLILGE